MRPGFSKWGLTLICLTGASWAFSWGVGTQLTTHWLKDLGARDDVIGLNHATYYFGLTVASLLASRFLRRWSLGWAAAGLVLCALSLALFPWSGGPAGWFTWRFVNGLASALSLLPLETLISRGSRANEQSWNFGLFNGSLVLGGAVGTALGAAGSVLGWVVYVPGSTLAFLPGAIAALGAALLLCSNRRRVPWEVMAEEESAASSRVDWAGNFLSFGTAWIQGFLEGGMVVFMPLYLEQSLNMTTELAGILVGVTLAGVLIVQVPVGSLADRCGRLPVLMGAYVVIIAGLCVLPWCRSTPWVGFWLCTLGAATGALYPLGMSLLGDRVRPSALVRAYSWYLAFDCIGSQVGAAVMGKARDLWGESAMFGAGLAAVGLVLGTAGLLAWHGRRRQLAAVTEFDGMDDRRVA